jgi:hypothetical protein
MMNELKLRLQLWLDTKLIPEWEKALQMLSVQWNLVMGVLTSIWLAVPDDQRSALASMLGVNPGVLVVLGVVVSIYHPEDEKVDPS